MIREVTEQNLALVRAFLEAHIETSLFLLSNLDAWGPRVGEHPYSGNFRVLEENGRIVAAFALTRRGTLLLQTGGRDDLGASIIAACSGEPMRIEGVLGEWESASALWQILCQQPDFRATRRTRDILYRLRLTQAPQAQPLSVRPLCGQDFDEWDPHLEAFLAGEGLPQSGTPAERRTMFESQVAAHHWWGAFQDGHLVSTAALNARYRDIGQVGGVYTRPEYRRRGMGREVMHALMRDARNVHGLNRLVLFTGEHNRAARAMYESLGFERCGSFALLFGSWAT